MKWLTRLLDKLKSLVAKEPAQETPAQPAAEPAPTTEPAEAAPETAAAAETPAAQETPAAEEPAAVEEPADEAAPAVAEPALAKESPAAEPAVAERAAPAEEAPAEPVAAPEKAPAAKESVPATVAEAVDAPAAGEEGPFGPGSAKPLSDGSAPGEEYTVKGKRSSKLFHTAESPYFGRTKADVWFKTAADAESAGFAAWNHKKKAAAK